MQTYISLLRGINVSGQKIIKMDALRLMYEALGFEQVRSYLQSGNVLFQAQESNTIEIAQRIKVQIATRLIRCGSARLGAGNIEGNYTKQSIRC